MPAPALPYKSWKRGDTRWAMARRSALLKGAPVLNNQRREGSSGAPVSGSMSKPRIRTGTSRARVIWCSLTRVTSSGGDSRGGYKITRPPAEG